MIAALLICAPVCGATAAAPTVMGITLGAPLPFDECANSQSMAQFTSRTAVCWTKVTGGIADARRVDYPMSGAVLAPPFVTHDTIVEVIDGHVEDIRMSTSGISSQETVLAELKAKFGRPTRSDRRRLQNLMGAQFVGLTATWRAPAYTVTFDSTESGIDWGLVEVSSRTFDAAKAKVIGRPGTL